MLGDEIVMTSHYQIGFHMSTPEYPICINQQILIGITMVIDWDVEANIVRICTKQKSQTVMTRFGYWRTRCSTLKLKIKKGEMAEAIPPIWLG